ncbi:hypothetical protein [Roseomonas sp. BN140053]|uniref:hypothetical protein n=1 Tax=Roseomonas sp. BN140053 TaxID=3391898 RepID=UPI0039E8A411
MSGLRQLAGAYRRTDAPPRPAAPPALDHDAAEAAAMAEHYAAPAKVAPPASRPRDALDEWLGLNPPASSDPLRDGLLRGYRTTRLRPAALNPGDPA